MSLFSGCGGFDLGFKKAGFFPIAAYDWDEAAVHHYNQNIGPHAEVANLISHDIRGSLKKPQILLAGPPCQGFSTIGRRDPNDERNKLLPLAGRLAVNLRPKVIVIENVVGALSGENSKHWHSLNQGLRSSGYKTHSVIYNALDLGMAQQRRRVLMFAWNTSGEPAFDLPLFSPRRLDQVLSGVESLSNHSPVLLSPNSKLHKIAERIGPGQKLSNVRGGTRSVHTWHIPEVFGSTTAEECLMLETIMRIRRAERRRDTGDADPIHPNRLGKEFGSRTKHIIDVLF